MSLKTELAKSEPSKYPPILRLDTDDLPQLAKAKIGTTYCLTIDVKVVSLSNDEEYGDSKGKKTMASLKVTSIELEDAEEVPVRKPNLMAERMKKRA